MTIELVMSYDTTKFPFQETMKKVLGLEGDITQAHNLIQGSTNWNQITFQNDTATDFHKRYYKSPYYQEMIDLYHRFLQEWLLPQLEEDEYIVQKEPSFRIHIPNNTALGKRDDQSDDEIIGLHCDGDYNHPSAEINYMLTITGQSETNSCYVESEPNKGDFHAIHINYGEVFRFYGNKCRHYNKKNMTNQSRISFDFRVFPASQYKEESTVAVHSGRKFVVGEYYMRMKKVHHEKPHIIVANFAGTYSNILKYLLWCMISEKTGDTVLFYYTNKKELNDDWRYLPLNNYTDLIDKNIFYKLFEFPTGCSHSCLVQKKNLITLSYLQNIDVGQLPNCFSNVSSYYSSDIIDNKINTGVLVNERLWQNPCLPQIRQELHGLIQRHLKMKPSLQARIQQDLSVIEQLKRDGKKILGLLVRSSHHIHTECDMNGVFKYVDALVQEYDYILITTQVQPYLDMIKQKYGEKVLSFERKRIGVDVDWLKDISDKDFEEEIRMAIVDTYLLSQTDYILGPISNMLIGAIFYNPTVSFKLLQKL